METMCARTARALLALALLGPLAAVHADVVAPTTRRPLAAAERPPAAQRLHLRAGALDPLDPRDAEAIARAATAVPATLAVGPDVGLHVVQFRGAIGAEARALLRTTAGEIGWHLPEHARVVRLGADAAAALRASPLVRAVVPYAPAWRLSEDLVEAPPEQERYVLMLRAADAAVRDAVVARLAAIGARVERARAGKHLVEATLTAAQLHAAARWDEILFVERWSPFEADMDVVRGVGGANAVEGVAGFTGVGVRGEVLDVGFNLGHVDFADRPLILHTAVGSDHHGASCTGILFGSGSGDATKRGMLPEGQGIVLSWELAGEGPSRYDRAAELVQPPYEGLFQSASVGSTRTTLYTAISAETDAMLFDLDLVLCQSQSNMGNQESRPQAWAKNAISVGAVRHFGTADRADDCWGCGASAASIGPAADGRIKPDLCHFYDLVGTTTSGSPTAYTETFGGTSAATPIVAGHAGLMFEMWSAGVFGNPADPGASPFANRCRMTTAKALLINTASPYAFSGTTHDLSRTHQGWGLPDVQALYALRERMAIVDETDVVRDGEASSYAFDVPRGEPALRATLVYADPPGNPAAAIHRINDLTLRVTSPSGTVYWGNHGLDAGNWSAPGGAPNTIDTVENVFVADPEPGRWQVEVLAAEINADGHVETAEIDADYALVVSGVIAVPPALALSVQPPPALVPPGVPVELVVEIADGSEGLVPGSVRAEHRVDAGAPWTTIPLAPHGDGTWRASLPAAPCGAMPAFFVAALGDEGTEVRSPPSAPDALHGYAIGVEIEAFADDGETAAGWTASTDAAVTGGAWEHGAPAGGGLRGDPPTDADGSGACWLTGNAPGDSDVDGAFTRLLSPSIDASGLGDPWISYARWFACDDAGGLDEDVMLVQLSGDDGATWSTLEIVAGDPAWRTRVHRVLDHVAIAGPLRLRVRVGDDPNDSITEAALDAIRVFGVECVDPVPGDPNGDGTVDLDDVLLVLSSWGACAPAPCAADANHDGVVDFADLLLVLAAWEG